MSAGHLPADTSLYQLSVSKVTSPDLCLCVIRDFCVPENSNSREPNSNAGAPDCYSHDDTSFRMVFKALTACTLLYKYIYKYFDEKRQYYLLYTEKIMVTPLFSRGFL